jgi:hypothetical protein
MLLDWTPAPAKLNMWEMWQFTGVASVTSGSTAVKWSSGDFFSIWWTAGSVINLNGRNYRIASVDSNQSLQLDSPWLGSTAAVNYTANNTGFLIRKKTTSADVISIQYATFDYSYSDIQPIDSSGVQQLYWTCSPVEQNLGGGKLGRLCATAQGFYAYESATGLHRSLGSPAIYVPGQYPSQPCPLGLSAAVFDAVNPNAFYCLATDVNNRSSLFQGTYHGNFSDIGPANYNSVSLAPCNGGNTNQPCVAFTNLTPPPNNLEAQIAALHPAWSLAPTKFIAIGGRQGAQIGLWGHMGNQNSMGWEFTFDPVTNRVSAASPTFAYWPSRWAGIHSWNNTQDANYLRQPIGDLATPGNPGAGDDLPGLGPFGAKMLSWWNGSAYVSGAATPTTGFACPHQPVGSPIAQADWPTGNNCMQIQVDGETCDPSPGVFTQASVSSGNTLADIVAPYGVWYPGLDGKPIVINGVTYTFHFLTATTGTISPAASASYSGQAYRILVESAVNNPKCGTPTAFYLQDAAVRDVLMFTAGSPASWKTQNTEFMRLLIKDGTNWWLERGYKGQTFNTAWPQNLTIWQFQTSCVFKILAYEGCTVEWNFIADPLGQNATGTTMLVDTNNLGGHTGTAFYPGFKGIDAKPYALGSKDCVPMTDWRGFTQYPCYEVRQGGIPGYITAPVFFAGAMPSFAGLLGIGTPNGVDSHPTVNQISAPPGEQTWFMDARPLNGDDNMVGTAASPGINVGGSLWKYTFKQRGCSTAAICTQQRKILPTIAGINRYPLLDISGPARGNLIGTTASDWFKYCVAEHLGECRTGSAVGDLFVNGPISTPYCGYPGIAVGGGGIFDPCIGPAGAFTENIVQYGVGAPGDHDWNATRSRALSRGLVRYRWLSPFWNVRTSNDGKWLFFRSDWLDGVRSEWMIAQIPPYPMPDSINRADFVPVSVNVSPPAGVAGVTAEFGYAENGPADGYFCTSRQEICVKGNQPANGFDFAGDNVPELPCTASCSIVIPAISQHVIYFRLKYLTANGTLQQVSEPHVAIVP